MLMYEVYEEKCVDEENKEYFTYGVRCSDKHVSDVTCNKEKMISFVNTLNNEEVEPVHLMDVIEDNIDDLI